MFTVSILGNCSDIIQPVVKKISIVCISPADSVTVSVTLRLFPQLLTSRMSIRKSIGSLVVFLISPRTMCCASLRTVLL